MKTKEQIINEVYQMLKDRIINPQGTFDSSGRFYLSNNDLINVRTPSRAYPYSEMNAGRTKKYVAKVCDKYGCTTVRQLMNRV